MKLFIPCNLVYSFNFFVLFILVVCPIPRHHIWELCALGMPLSDLSVNFFRGSIPASLGLLQSLQWLDLSYNFFHGSIPASLGLLPSLQLLYLSQNELSGPVPDEFGNMTSLRELVLSDNLLSGELAGLGNLSYLQTLAVAVNKFTGDLPATFANLKKLQAFYINGDNFSGRVPEFIANWTNLQELSLIGNNLEGPLPSGIFALERLSLLWVSDLSGDSRGLRFPPLSRMKDMSQLILRNCSITGQIPDYIGQMSSLEILDLSFNYLTGEIPESFSNLNLVYMYLTRNNLTGAVPGWVTNSSRMLVDVSHNNFTGLRVVQPHRMPSYVNTFACCSPNAKNLTDPWQHTDFSCDHGGQLYDQLYINCGGKNTTFEGSNYEADLNKQGDSTFYMSPKRNWGYSSTGDSQRLNYTVDKTCGVPTPDASLLETARVSPLSLKYYGFCLRSGNYTVRLRFAEIIFTDEQDRGISEKRVFDVFIQGKIVLKDFNIKDEAKGPNREVVRNFTAVVTNQRLEIHLYWSGKGTISMLPSYGPLVSAISVTRDIQTGHDKRLGALSIAGIGGSVLLLLVFFMFVLWKMGFIGGKDMCDEELKGGGFFSLQQIKAATQNFSSANKIGEGGFGAVYKGILPNGMAIAVKQLSSKSKQGTQEFVNEVGTISALQHPHLVKLLGCCTEDNQLLLIYEYMENNCLARALFGSEECRLELNWSTRMKICLGIAKGLAFLHEESRLKIVHRDIKATNVLLDNDLNAKIADFGLAKLYEGEETHIVTKIAGTLGYIAPEYAMRGYLTNKADVYSFGVVTLEIVSGKSNASNRPNEEFVYLLDLAYVLQEKGDLLGLLDPTLGSDYSVEEAMRMLHVAMLCTNPSPTLRPTMSAVVSILEGKTTVDAPTFCRPFSTDDFMNTNDNADLSTSEMTDTITKKEI